MGKYNIQSNGCLWVNMQQTTAVVTITSVKFDGNEPFFVEQQCNNLLRHYLCKSH
jgi:hypothetical protein